MTESAAGTATPGLDPDAVGVRLAELFDEPRWRDLRAELIAGGRSNLTYRLISPAGSVVLRRPPTGHVLPKAHDMGREARIQQALYPTGVPVPKVHTLEGPELLGAAYYVMEDVPGLVINDTLPEAYDDPDSRRAIGLGLIDTLIALHQVDPDRVGLSDYGRPEGFLERQVRTWSKQWELSKTEEVPELDRLRDLLSDGVPQAQRNGIVHGDFKLNNVLISPDDPGRVNAVLDWELSTLGDPLADLGMLMLYWTDPGDQVVPISAVTAAEGFPDRAELAQRYAEGTGLDLSDLDFYTAYAYFKFAVIVQGVVMRSRGGAMGDQDFSDFDQLVAKCAVAGLEIFEDN
ncbi:phosphotransferase family protein [Naumannella halotolerans]|uniref:Aminoglycoside phosphotransferase (APT) family kinase protein n=1 Tax=Naumannella halotolerans TaxID=993414 RepID=A0A4R7JBR7_9ACTN|nr:phosphotransferase family protein [Naumannella halotolerans]TDT34117.1 aminoglycoside phosphotransferase (APT) family kinase protein [Naumannella halotolerans]